MNILITGATGMFGGNLARHMATHYPEIKIKALARNKEKAIKQGLDDFDNMEIVVGDMSDTGSLTQCMTGIDRIFLVSPMVDGLDQLEINVINSAQKNGVNHIFKLYGAVEHDGDYLITLHNKAIDTLKSSSLNWTLISPNSVMETCILSYAEVIQTENAICGCSGHHKVGMVALQDVVSSAAALLSSDGHKNKEYILTGPESISMYQVAESLSKAANRTIQYEDYTDQEFEALIMQWLNINKEEADVQVMCHYRAWNKDHADIVTDTVYQITGQPATTIEQWCQKNKALFAKVITEQ